MEDRSGVAADREKTGAVDEDEDGQGRREGLVRISGTGVLDKGDVYKPGPETIQHQSIKQDSGGKTTGTGLTSDPSEGRWRAEPGSAPAFRQSRVNTQL